MSDVATLPAVTVNPNDNLHTVLRCDAQRQIDELLVVGVEDPTRVVCILHRDEVIAAYDQKLAELRAP